MKKLFIVATTLLSLSAIAFSASADVVVLSQAQTRTLKGQLVLIDSLLGSEPECKGHRGFADIYGGQQIVVKNAKGEIIAIGSLGAGVREKTEPNVPSVVCFFPIAIENVPISDFYEISIGSGQRGSLTYSQKELEAKNWVIELSLSRH